MTFVPLSIQAEVVAADEKETNDVRATLNLGHTFGHAIETGLGYGAWLHGEAVATGMLMAAEMSLEMNLIDISILNRLKVLLDKAGLPTTLQNSYAINELGQNDYIERVSKLTTTKFLDLMSMDKKVADGQLSLILLQGELGKSIITNKFNVNTLEKIVSKYCVH